MPDSATLTPLSDLSALAGRELDIQIVKDLYHRDSVDGIEVPFYSQSLPEALRLARKVGLPLTGTYEVARGGSMAESVARAALEHYRKTR